MAEDEIPDDHHHHPNGATAAKKQKLTSYITPSEIRSEFSHHSPTIARINNGSFGCCPATIIAAQKRHHLQFLQQPDHFFFNLRQPLIHKSRSLIKTLINADHVSEISLLDNVTTAAAVVLQHISTQFSRNQFTQNDAVLILSCAFESVKKSIHAYVTLCGGSVVVVDLPFPVRSNSQIVSHFRNAVYNAVKNDGKRIRLAIIDHITSMPCVLMPIKELVRVCREEGVDSVFVDAAHAIGTVNVDVKDIGADFYVSNLHKWLFCPPSVAFFYCRKSGFSSELHHPVVSNEYGNGLAVESAWIGTRDYSTQLVVPDILEFVGRFEGGIEGIMRRNHEAVVEMGEMLAEAWGTNLGCSPDMCSSMAMVGLPSSLGVLSNDDALKLRNHLREDFGVEVPLYYHQQKDGEVGVRDRAGGLVTAYARISHQVYNTVDDYIKFRDAINRLVQDGFSCKMLA